LATQSYVKSLQGGVQSNHGNLRSMRKTHRCGKASRLHPSLRSMQDSTGSTRCNGRANGNCSCQSEGT
jgi:hypothetical protein